MVLFIVLFIYGSYFQMTEPITPHIALIAVAIILGFVGGILGAVFTLCSTQIVSPARARVLSKACSPFLYKVLRVFECLLIVVSINYNAISINSYLHAEVNTRREKRLTFNMTHL